ARPAAVWPRSEPSTTRLACSADGHNPLSPAFRRRRPTEHGALSPSCPWVDSRPARYRGPDVEPAAPLPRRSCRGPEGTMSDPDDTRFRPDDATPDDYDVGEDYAAAPAPGEGAGAPVDL